jgi:hypothetical protein
MIGIIYMGHIKRCPFLTKYVNMLDEKNEVYDIIYWDRTSDAQMTNNTYNARKTYAFNLQSKEQRHPYKKVFDFIMFSKYVRKIIHQNGYNKLIILTTMTGVFLFDVLLREYKNKYIFDYRDASYENNLLFRKVLEKIIDASYFTCISSEGFKSILPIGREYVMAHNMNFSTKTPKTHSNCYNYRLPIKVSFIGGIRGIKYMKSLIDAFANDERFEFFIHGGGENFNEIVNYSKNFKNVLCTGEYEESQKKEFIKQADILCYNYPESFNNNVALANKYYDGLIFKKPLLGNIKTFSGRLIEKNEVGISLDMESPDFKDKLLNYLKNLDYDEFYNRTEQLLGLIDEEEIYYLEKIGSFIEKDTRNF